MTSPASNSSANPPLSNPLLKAWTTPQGAPPFAEIAPAHFREAFDRAFAAHDSEVDAIAKDVAAPTFDNTVVALERSGSLLDRVSSVFYALAGAHTNDDLLAIEREISPRMASHWSRIRLNDALFTRIDTLWNAGEKLSLNAEQARVLERYHINFRRSGAGLDAAKKERLSEITERLATNGTNFSQNVLADEQSWMLELSEDDLAGLPDFMRTAAREAAQERGLDGKRVITLSRSSVEPFLQASSRRDLREKAFRAWIARGDNNNATDNKALIAETVALRAERAKLLGYGNFAEYRLDDAMAKTPAAVRGLLERVWKPAVKRANIDRDAMQELMRAEGANEKLAAWDWRYYAEKLRKAHFDLDEAELKPYLTLDNMIAAAFACAQKLFGITATPRMDVPAWHPDVKVWDIHSAQGRLLGTFFGDYYARASKRSGAWMTVLRDQRKMMAIRARSSLTS